LGNRNIICKNEHNTENSNSKSEKQRYNNVSSAILLASVLLMATFVSWPNQNAFAHESGFHDLCFEHTTTAVFFLITESIKAAIASFVFGTAFLVLIAATLAIAIGLVLNLLCKPQLIPPPQSAGEKAAFFECNTVRKGKPGFVADSDDTEITKPGPLGLLITRSTLKPTFLFREELTDASPPKTEDFGLVHEVESIFVYGIILVNGLIDAILDVFVPGEGLSFLTKFFITFVLSLFTGAIAAFTQYSFILSIFEATKRDGSAAHPNPAIKIGDMRANFPSDNFFELGNNKVVYSAVAQFKFTSLDKFPFPTDDADFLLNVVDTDPPLIVFENQTLTLEANAHFGFRVDGFSKKELGEVTVIDRCHPDLQPDYVGREFFPLTSIVEDQRTLWAAVEPSYDIWALPFDNISEAFQAYSDNLAQAKEIDEYNKVCDQEFFNSDPRLPPFISECNTRLVVKPDFNVTENLFGIDRNDALDKIRENSPFTALKESRLTKLLVMKNLSFGASNATVIAAFDDGMIDTKKLVQAIVFTNSQLEDTPTKLSFFKVVKNIVQPENPYLAMGVKILDSSSGSRQKILEEIVAKLVIDPITNIPTKLADRAAKKAAQEVLGEVADIAALQASGTAAQVARKSAESTKLLTADTSKGIKGLGGPILGKGAAVGIGFGLALADELIFASGDPSTVQINGFESYGEQKVIIIDTLPPDILVLNHIAVEVNSTHPVLTKHPIVNSCSGVDPNITCNLSISPPLVNDIADPFPLLLQNLTGNFTELEDSTADFEGVFKLGLTKIAWKAVDFSNNTSDEVILNVNLKLNGTNDVSKTFDQNVTEAFWDFPTKITLNATNPDTDPLEFFISKNPDNGVIETPIEAVFQTKFQKFGTISTLKGLYLDLLRLE